MRLGTSKLLKGVGEHPNGLRQVLDVPGEDLHLCGFLQCSRTALALGSPSALRTGRGRVLVALVILVGLLFHGLSKVCKWCGGAGITGKWLLERRCALLLAPKSKEKHHGVRWTLVGSLLRALRCLSQSLGDPDGLYSEWSRWVDMLRVANTVSAQSGGGGWHQSRDKDMYSDRFRTSSVRLCRVAGVARLATVRFSTGMGWRDKDSMGSQRRANSGISNPTEVLVGQPSYPRRDSVCNCDPTSLVWSGLIRWSDLPYWECKRAYWFSRTLFSGG
ncbi:hypothetical protein TIFTF001_036290 [Ficus carica]|uniref:Uncharacterized protein n=1 Tax=Ficus carica TaxID=3494 RepID=A0AA88E6I8_FICCA|nr:hypothetical protein TIFTF001_036290 [Ficus carica]